MNPLFASGGQNIGVSILASVLPKSIQDWFPLGLTSWISLQSKGLSGVFSNTTVQKHQCHQFNILKINLIITYLNFKLVTTDLKSFIRVKAHIIYFTELITADIRTFSCILVPLGPTLQSHLPLMLSVLFLSAFLLPLFILLCSIVLSVSTSWLLCFSFSSLCYVFLIMHFCLVFSSTSTSFSLNALLSSASCLLSFL